MRKSSTRLPPPSPGNSVRVERAKVVHQRRAAACEELGSMRGHRSVAEGRGRWRSLCRRAAHLSHLLLLEEKQEVRGGCLSDTSTSLREDPHTH